MANVNFNTVAQASSANVNDYIHLTTEGGSHRKVLIQKLVEKAKAEALSHTEAQMLDALTSGCLIAYHENDYDGIFLCNPSRWTNKQNQGEVADGVLVVEGDKHIIVAPTESPTPLHWGSVNVMANTNISWDQRNDAILDFNGKAKTAAILANPAYSSDGTDYAPAFCAAYSRTNKNGKGLTAGKWWLPSAGELLMMGLNTTKINACLELIEGANLLTGEGIWASTESSAIGAWFLYSNQGFFGTAGKISNVFYARPVSSYQN